MKTRCQEKMRPKCGVCRSKQLAVLGSTSFVGGDLSFPVVVVVVVAKVLLVTRRWMMIVLLDEIALLMA